MAFEYTLEKQRFAYVDLQHQLRTCHLILTHSLARRGLLLYHLPPPAVYSSHLGAISSAVGAGLCLFVLIIAGLVWLHQPSRHHLDRVSFRVVMLALVAK